MWNSRFGDNKILVVSVCMIIALFVKNEPIKLVIANSILREKIQIYIYRPADYILLKKNYSQHYFCNESVYYKPHIFNVKYTYTKILHF